MSLKFQALVTLISALSPFGRKGKGTVRCVSQSVHGICSVRVCLFLCLLGDDFSGDETSLMLPNTLRFYRDHQAGNGVYELTDTYSVVHPGAEDIFEKICAGNG